MRTSLGSGSKAGANGGLRHTLPTSCAKAYPDSRWSLQPLRPNRNPVPTLFATTLGRVFKTTSAAESGMDPGRDALRGHRWRAICARPRLILYEYAQ